MIMGDLRLVCVFVCSMQPRSTKRVYRTDTINDPVETHDQRHARNWNWDVALYDPSLDKCAVIVCVC